MVWSPASRCGAAVPSTNPSPLPSACATSRTPATVSDAEEGRASEGSRVDGRTTSASFASAARVPSPGSAPAPAISVPSGPYSTARPPRRRASCWRTEGTGSGRAAAVARLCWASVTRRSSAVRVCAISCHSARATAENVVRGGTSSSGSPCISHASTSAAGTVSCTGATPEAERHAARRDDPRHVRVEVARAGAVRDVHARRQQQLAAQQVRVGVGHLRGVRPVHHGRRVRGARDPAQAQVRAGQQRVQGDGRGGRNSGVRHDGRFLHPRLPIWMKRTLRSRFSAT